MAATAAQIATLRGYIAEPTENTYTDEALAARIEQYPVPDSDGNWPDESDWTATYDLHRVAAEIWGEKAAATADYFDHSADGQRSSLSQIPKQALQMAAYHQARQCADSVSPRRRDVPREDAVTNAD